MPCLLIDARHVARIGIAIWIAIFDIKKRDEVIPMFDCFRHLLFLLLFVPLLLLMIIAKDEYALLFQR